MNQHKITDYFKGNKLNENKRQQTDEKSLKFPLENLMNPRKNPKLENSFSDQAKFLDLINQQVDSSVNTILKKTL